jgi:GNAT superfamily N-acetyltransferase
MADGTGRDWARVAVEMLDPANPPDASGFRPTRGEFATYWKKGRIERETRAHLGRCWFARNDAGKLAGYITLFADRLTVESPLLAGEGVQYHTFPAVKIGLLAVDKRAKGLGTALVKWAFAYMASELSQRLGIRFATVDALHDPDSDYDTAPFYSRFGFTFTDGEGRRVPGQAFRAMYFDLKPILDALAETQH